MYHDDDTDAVETTIAQAVTELRRVEAQLGGVFPEGDYAPDAVYERVARAHSAVSHLGIRTPEL